MESLVEEILGFFPEFKITISDLKTPSCPFVSYFYVRVLSELGVDVDHVQRVQINQLDAESIDILPKLNLVTAVKSVFPFLNFTLGDLLSPDFKRNLALMRDVMKFLQLCEQRCAANNAAVEVFQERKLKEQQLKMVKDQKSSLLNKLAMEVDSCHQAKPMLEEQISSLKEDINRYKSDYKILEQQIKEIATDISSKQTKLEALEREIKAITEECEAMKKLIVNNPEDERREFDLKAKERDRIMKDKKEYQEKYKALRAELEQLQKQGEALSKQITRILDELHVIKEYSDLKNLDTKAKENLEELNKKKDELINELSELDNKTEIEKHKLSQKVSELEGMISSQKQSLEEKRSEYKMNKSHLNVNYKKSLEDLEKVQNRIKSIENAFSTLLDSYNALMKVINSKKNTANLTPNKYCDDQNLN